MRPEIRQILLTMVLPLFLIFILYMIKVLEIGMDWDFTSLGVYPLSKKGMFGIFTHPLIHSGFKHLLTNTLPLFFLSWCLFYFYRGIAGKIFILIWFGGGLLTFLIGKPGWHIGASGLIYGLAFFLFFSGILPQICSTHCHLFTCHLFIWRDYMAYVSLFLPHQYVVGRTS